MKFPLHLQRLWSKFLTLMRCSNAYEYGFLHQASSQLYVSYGHHRLVQQENRGLDLPPIPWGYSPFWRQYRTLWTGFGAPTILNFDQDSQFTSSEYKQLLKDLHIRQSIDGKSRQADNIMIERWFRSLKTELIYVNEFTSSRQLWQSIRGYVEDYNRLRSHEALGYATLDEVYGAQASALPDRRP